MLLEEEIREASRRRMRIMLPATLCVVSGAILYLFVMMGIFRDSLISLVASRWGKGAGESVPAILVFSAFPILLIPAFILD